MRNRKLLITAISLVLCLTVSVGIAFAYFTDYEDARGGAIVRLNGQTEINENVDDTGKTVSISNAGETPMVTRVMFIGDTTKITSITKGDNWSGPEGDGWYYYTKVLAPAGQDGSSTSDIKATITVTENDDVKDFDVIVVHESARAVYDGDAVVVPDGWASVTITE